jgi:MoaA/NifB/PqqE/SkfB family radical SAM enzyme
MQTSRPPERKPRIVGWEITNQCNLSCVHCFTAAGKRPHDELTTKECKRIIDSMAAIGVATIGWTGGEPLLRGDLEELAGYAAHKGIMSNITTNAVLLDSSGQRATMVSVCAVQINLGGSRLNRTAAFAKQRRTIPPNHSAIRLCKSLNLRFIWPP